MKWKVQGLARTRTRTCTHSQTRARTHARSCTYSQTRTHTHAHAHIHKHAHTHARKKIRLYTCRMQGKVRKEWTFHPRHTAHITPPAICTIRKFQSSTSFFESSVQSQFHLLFLLNVTRPHLSLAFIFPGMSQDSGLNVRVHSYNTQPTSFRHVSADMVVIACGFQKPTYTFLRHFEPLRLYLGCWSIAHPHLCFIGNYFQPFFGIFSVSRVYVLSF